MAEITTAAIAPYLNLSSSAANTSVIYTSSDVVQLNNSLGYIFTSEEEEGIEDPVKDVSAGGIALAIILSILSTLANGLLLAVLLLRRQLRGNPSNR